MSEKNTVCRFAPSPTGPLHMGGVRSALFNYLYARQNKGKLILRIEDTDMARSSIEFENDIIDGFRWLGLSFDETVRQSNRLEIYKRYLKELINSNKAYLSKEKSEDGKRDEVIRFKNPNSQIIFKDLIKGEISFDTTELGDFVIAKSMDEPLYHLAVVVDDFEMGITHVIRGEDHISNTPRQILIGEAIGASRPFYSHIPLLLATDKSKLSKRKHGDQVSLRYYRQLGFLPEAIINYIALLGWNPGTDRELFTLEDLVKEFSLDRVQKSNAVFDIEKLKWFNKTYLSKLAHKQLLLSINERLGKMVGLSNLTDLQKSRLSLLLAQRISYLGEIEKLFDEGEFSYITKNPEINKESLKWKKDKDLTISMKMLSGVSGLIQKLSDYPEIDESSKIIMPYAEKEGRGSVLWPLRFALTGMEKSPDPFTVISILGRDKSLERIKTAIDLIK